MDIMSTNHGFNLSNAENLRLDEDDILSSSDIKHLFFIWFNSISNDGVTINLSQFTHIMNRIFLSSTLSQTEITQTFQQIANHNNTAHYNTFLSPPEHTFVNIMIQWLEKDEIALSSLQSVPNKCVNNPTNNTLQQLLYDQCKHIIALKEWIIAIGLPSHHKNSTLHQELSELVMDKSRLDLELLLVEREQSDLKTDQDFIAQNYSALNEQYAQSLQQISDLKALNLEYKALNDVLKASLDSVKADLLQEKTQNKQYNDDFQTLQKSNEHYHESNKQLTIKSEYQHREITKISSAKQQIQTTLEKTQVEMRQKEEQIHALQTELQIFQLNYRKQSYDSIHSNTSELRRIPMAILTPTNSKSFILPLRTPNPLTLKHGSSFESDLSDVKLYDSNGTPTVFSFGAHSSSARNIQINADKNMRFGMYCEEVMRKKSLDINSEATSSEVDVIEFNDMKAMETVTEEKTDEEEEDEFEPLLDTMHKKIVERKLPKGFNEDTKNQCVIFGWKFW